jgi:hypothetical protein
MTAVWVANDIYKNGTFSQSKGEMLCTILCIAFVKKFYPEWKRVFFVDSFTKPIYESLGVLDLVDEVNDTLLDESIAINTDIFWAGGKIRAQRAVEGPLVLFDLDVRFQADLKQMGLFDKDVACMWLEDTSRKYFSPEYALQNTGLTYDFDWDERALNVSLLYFKDEDFKNLYCDTSLEYMITSSQNLTGSYTQDEKNAYIMFTEQYMLNQLAKKHNKEVKLAIDGYTIDANTPPPTVPEYISGIGVDHWSSSPYILHYGRYKDHFKQKIGVNDGEINLMSELLNENITDELFIQVFNDVKNNYDN